VLPRIDPLANGQRKKQQVLSRWISTHAIDAAFA
jgi:hypothetical protein